MKMWRVLVALGTAIAILSGLDGCSLYEVFTGADIAKTITPQPATVIRSEEATTLTSQIVRIVDQVASKHGFYRYGPPHASSAHQSVDTLAFYKDNPTQPPRGLTVFISVIKQKKRSLPEVVIVGEDLSSGDINEASAAIVGQLRNEIQGISFIVEKNVTYGRF